MARTAEKAGYQDKIRLKERHNGGDGWGIR